MPAPVAGRGNSPCVASSGSNSSPEGAALVMSRREALEVTLDEVLARLDDDEADCVVDLAQRLLALKIVRGETPAREANARSAVRE